jgi:hypothetical protein
MNKPDSILFAAATRALFLLKEETGHFSNEIYAQWRALLPEIFFEYYSESDIVMSISRCHREKWTAAELKEIVDSLAEADRDRYTSLIDFYLILLKQRGDIITYRYLHQTRLENLGYLLPESEATNHLTQSWINNREKESFRPIIHVEAVWWIVAFDFLLRLAGLYTQQALGWIYQTKEATALFTNFLIVPIIVVFTGYLYKKANDKSTLEHLRAMQMPDLKILPKITGWHYFAITFLAIAGVAIGELHIDRFTDRHIILFVLLSAIIWAWYFFLLKQFSLPLPDSVVIYKKLKEQDKIETQDELDTEENDIEITNLEVRLSSLNERMNAYVLEAALFGALAFSGFLQIISSEVFTLNAFSEFNSAAIEIFRGMVTGSSFELSEGLLRLEKRHTLLSLLCYESLFCSICFISVIASRLRQTDIADKMQKALLLSQNFNEKENRLNLTHGHQKPELLRRYNKTIKLNLQEAVREYKKILPVLEFIRFFRTLGIFSFFIILITAGLFISPLLAIIFSLIFILSVLYFQFPKIKLAFLLIRLKLQDMTASLHKYITPAFLFFSIFMLMIRSTHLPGTQIPYLLWLAIIILYQFTMLLEGTAMNETNVVKTKLFRISAILFTTGIIFQLNNFPGRALFFLISTILFVYFFTSEGFKKKHDFSKRIKGIGYALFMMALLSKIQMWGVAKGLIISSTIVLLLSLLLTLKNKSFVHFPTRTKIAIAAISLLGLLELVFPEFNSFLFSLAFSATR